MSGFSSNPQTPGGGHPPALASSHSLGRQVGLAGRWTRPVPSASDRAWFRA